MILALLGLLSALLLAPIAMRRWQVLQLARLCAARRTIILTYDDGPSPETTRGLADLLARRGVPASFFMIGSRAEANPDLVARLLSEGHEIGNHTQTHMNAWKTWPLAAVRDVQFGRQALARLGVNQKLFRPPYGKTTMVTMLQLWINGERPTFWTIDTRDSWEQPRAVGEVLGMIERQGGGVILMHDFAFAPRGALGHRHPEHVLQMTDAIIDLAVMRNYALLRIGDLDTVEKRTHT